MCDAGILRAAQDELPSLLALYEHLHAHPELSLCEHATAARLAVELRGAGCAVTEGVGGTGVVGVLKNGTGPTVMLRADMDALPMAEATGLAHASRVRAPGHDGEETRVMHACGHDAHMACLVGAARVLAALRHAWSGTLLLVGQPGEEGFDGARTMLADGLFSRFPRPDAAVALHVAPRLPAGSVGYTPGQAMAGTCSVDAVVHGVTGHSSQPAVAVNALEIAAGAILDIKHFMEREFTPEDRAVCVPTRLAAGSAHNIVPATATLLLNLRYPDEAVKTRILDGVRRILDKRAGAAGLGPELRPELTVQARGQFPPLHNDPATARIAARALVGLLGADKVIEVPYTPVSEDFADYGEMPDAPALFHFWLGAADPALLAAHGAARPADLPPEIAGRLSLHTPHFRPEAGPALATGAAAMARVAVALLRPAAQNDL